MSSLILLLVFLVTSLKESIWDEKSGGCRSTMQVERIEDEEMRSLIRPEEDRRRLHPDRPWQGGFRWFRSENVIPLEQWRARKLAQTHQPQGVKS